MQANHFTQKLSTERGSLSSVPDSSTHDDDHTTPGYSTLRQNSGKAVSLMLELHTGDILAPEYSYLMDKQFFKATGEIHLRFTHCEIMLRGRNLMEIFRPLCQHRLASVVEIPEEVDIFGNGVAVVNTIEISP